MKFNTKLIILGLIVLSVSLLNISCSDNVTADTVLVSKTLHWTATGDDGIQGTATTYFLRYSTDSDSLVNHWADLPLIPGLPTPSLPLTADSVTFSLNYEVGVQYFFAMKVADEVQPKVSPTGEFNAINWTISGADTVAVESATVSGGSNLSSISNIASVYFQDATPPSPINDLTFQ